MTRSSFVDVLRGFALLGIGIVNLPHLALPLAAAIQSPDGAIDMIVDRREMRDRISNVLGIMLRRKAG